ncbi:phage tail protein [Algoriphagus machipongonensis]|uniref:Phospholipid/glycerol acyltransferase n=1 Tax=Algoriphagus machipongonensis TaxID=388413 RepID=A3HTC0_9BACT|nr:phage tail protein [Algoriphagus machipongonensis]7AEB_Y Chain Y, Phospholipid/glycerol acyltransferase [Algoriphagus machipongonensis]7AEB_Z Chain Z, Phospholipid/glycerol acyltransferase [Algoriphagus machipongonensis]7AEB_a Chain a, Phospholipid/glycerol acyltransferase [Algoriphagus machipongonensis]7AEB_b Chain b, Phospholipid/glycerol acyltransferase [Algoriphagus machipongonensis]7AEB_c Chain c, Phospholipid/glycerol acyltransferase [Algoriphagus machipongonensis]7AEB_d Chain d, Pho
MATYYPPSSFHFLVEFTGIDAKNNDHEFQSVSGLSVDIDTEEFAEGGENRFKHKFPVKTKYPNLVLKRGVLVDSKVISWCRDAIEDFEFKPIDLTVKLLNEEHQPLMTWNVVHAYPVKWSVEDFNAQESKMAIESVELSYNYFKTIV